MIKNTLRLAITIILGFILILSFFNILSQIGMYTDIFSIHNLLALLSIIEYSKLQYIRLVTALFSAVMFRYYFSIIKHDQTTHNTYE